ncbi:hypothetical protein PYW07_015888 [Mythimna separata]|uniref:Uncharacterized protein n=1 Tax=Mythimna separata TaxID=271217 RepID=A0AAD8DUU6_MYTSE|nr:hypothetical protein PYW07_015888 [Mythimna separata]
MTTAAKAQKDKPFGTTPRLLPRPTAASAARAARNATNRNLTIPNQRLSPSRSVNGPKVQGKTTPTQRVQKTDSKTDIKGNGGSSDNEQSENVSPPELDNFTIESPPTAVTEEQQPPEEPVAYESAVVSLPDINENSPLEIKMSDDGGEPNENRIYESDITPPIARKTESRSRPQTPSLSSRPQTPKSIHSSRPRTPRVPSRPTTPSNPAHRVSTTGSRPNTPQRSSAPARPKTPSLNVPPSSRVLSPVSVCSPSHSFKDPEDIKTTFLSKQKQFHRMKKELDMKQQAVLELFDSLRGLREHMTKEGVSGCGDIQLQELVVFNVADWTSDEVSQLCRDAVASATPDGVEIINATPPIDESVLTELDSKVSSVPTCFADLCLQAFTARQEIIDWVKELIDTSEAGSGESLERIARYNAQGLQLCETLRELKTRADDAVETVTQFSKRTFRERSALVSVGESLVREIARLRQDLETRSVVISELQEIHDESERNRPSEDTRRELEEERAAKAATKDKLATTESQLRQARVRISKMDRQLREAEASIASLTGTVKTLEDQSRQREVQLEARARKLKESLKTGEVTSSQLVHQRDSLQNDVLDLKQQIENLTTQHKAAVHELNVQLKEFRKNLEEQRNINQKEMELKEAAESALQESQRNIEELKAKINEMEINKPNPDLPTEREMDIWAELQATKDTLRITEDEVTSCKREKVRFLETLTKITEPDNKVGMQQKLAAELLSKEEILAKMQIQIRELTKNIKLNEQKVIQYEQYVQNLQAHNRAVANCQEAPNGISYQDLQQEIMNLRMGLLDAVHRNEELQELLVQKEQQLEQQDKTSRAQARVIKVREELINMLKNKETEQSRELSALQQDLEHRMKVVDEVNKQIAAKAEEIQELFATLENKQQQIHRLEKIVLALEEQQRRAQAQRTRHEEKIAALEHELAASGNRRERKFLFF